MLNLQREGLGIQESRDRLRHKEQIKRLENDDARNKRLHRLALLSVGLVALLLAFLLGMAFFGMQSSLQLRYRYWLSVAVFWVEPAGFSWSGSWQAV